MVTSDIWIVAVVRGQAVAVSPMGEVEGLLIGNGGFHGYKLLCVELEKGKPRGSEDRRGFQRVTTLSDY
jgi:hypothetical protein